MIGDGSKESGWAFVEALRYSAKLLFRDHREKAYNGPHRIHRSFLDVIAGVLHFLDYRTGELNAGYASIAEKSDVHLNTAKRAIEAFEYWGLIQHVRRSEKIAEADGLAGPQRKQAPNAYFFDCRREMPTVLWQKFWSRLIWNLKRFGHEAAKRAAQLGTSFNEKAKQAPRKRGQLGNLLAAIERANFRGDVSAPWVGRGVSEST